uniref:RlpA-like protein double-psi beta-barrel domain-containing protein n=1 Tax=Phakopsora pachyrhizi TaxID=170000 RepID=A0A0S1MIW2_PHAPC
MFYVTVSLLVSLCFLSVSGLPTTSPATPQKAQPIQKRYSGKATWFIPDTGACGDKNSESDYIVAMNQAQYNGGSNCHKTVNIKNQANGKSVTAKVTDKCPGCSYGSLDLSPSTFKALGSLDTGVLPINWDMS